MVGVRLLVCLVLLTTVSIATAALPPALQEKVALYHLKTKNYLPAMAAYLELSSQYRDPLAQHRTLLQVAEIAIAWEMYTTATSLLGTLEQKGMPAVRQQAREAKHRLLYRRKDWDALLASLATERQLSADERFYHLEALLRKGTLVQAASVLQGIDQTSHWYAFAQFNYAVREMRQDEAAAVRRIQKIALQPVRGDVADRASLLLGYHFLGKSEYTQAQQYLAQIAADSPYAQKALLALGWARAEAGESTRALGAWLPLVGAADAETSVQEASLAAAFTWARLGDRQQALDAYRAAITNYRELDSGLVEATSKISSRTLFHALLAPGALTDEDISRAVSYLSTVGAYRFLPQWLEQPGLRQSLSHYRDIELLRLRLDQNVETLQAYQSMLRIQARRTGRQGVKTSDSSTLLRYRKQHQALKQKLVSVSDGRRPFPMHNVQELAPLKAVRTLFVASQQKLAGKARREYIARLRRVRGLMLWKLQAETSARLVKAEEVLAQTDLLLDAVSGTSTKGVVEGPDDKKISQMIAQHRQLMTGLMPVRDDAESDLYALTASALGVTRGRLSFYNSQARFALAELFDTSGVADAN